jgi:hypothetical protein
MTTLVVGYSNGIALMFTIDYMPVCIACSGFAAGGFVLTCILGFLDRLDGGWINAGKPNPHLLEQSEKIPLLVNRD